MENQLSHYSPVAQLLAMDMRLNLVVTTATLLAVFDKPAPHYVAFLTADVEKYTSRVQRVMFSNDTSQAPVFTQAIRAASMEWYPCGTGLSVEVALAKLNAMVETGLGSIQESRYLEMVRMVGSELAHCIDQDWHAPDFKILSHSDEWMVA